MDTSIIAALIGIFGAAALGGLGFIFTSLRSEIRDNSTQIGQLREGFGRLDERSISEFGQIKDVLARIEATQAEHGRQIEKLSGGDLL